MTNPIPGADSERAEYRPALNEGAFFGKLQYSIYLEEVRELCARAAAKVGANVAADVPTWPARVREKVHPSIGPHLDDDELAIIGSKEMQAEIADLRAFIAAGAPAATPKPVAVELIGVAEQIEQGAGFWHSCCGCHDTEDGHPTGNYAYSNEMRCALGNGCAECGGLGAVWDNNDYSEAAGDFLAAQPAHAPIAPTEQQPVAIVDEGDDGLFVEILVGEHGTDLKMGEQLYRHPTPIAGDVEKDAARLDFMIQREAWLAWSKDGETCRLFHRDEDGDTGPMMGWIPEAWSHDPREAIDKALAAMLSNSSSGEAG